MLKLYLFFQILVEFKLDKPKILLKPSSDSQEGPKCFVVFRVLIRTGAGTWSREDGKSFPQYLICKLAVNKTKYT
jgi:hypothetical protein